MSEVTLTFTHRVNGTLTNVTSAALSDPTDTYGVKRNDTDEVVVADSTAMTNSATGVYTYTFTEPAGGDLTYTYFVKWVYAGVTNRAEFAATGAAAESSGSGSGTTITITPVSGYPLASATLTALTRLDTDTAVTLPSPATFTYADGVWTIDADLPAGVEVYWEADIVYSAGGTSGADGTLTVLPDPTTVNGTYYTWDGVKNLLGADNAAIASNLQNDNTDPDLTRVAADGAIADANVSRRARLAGHAVPLTAELTDDYSLVVFAANLLTAGLLVDHREWFTDQSAIPRDDQGTNEWTRRGEALLNALFGKDPTGIDQPGTQTPTTWLDTLRGLAPAPGRTRDNCGRAITYDTEGNPYPVTLAAWYSDPYYLICGVC